MLEPSSPRAVTVTFFARPACRSPKSKRLLAAQPQGGGASPARNCSGSTPMPDQVGAVDALVALGDHGPHAEELRALGRPVARAARAVLLAGQHQQRHAFGGVALAASKIVSLLAVGQVAGEAALALRHQAVPEPDVGEGAADHDLVVAAARAVGVELARLDALLEQPAPGRAVALIEPAGEMWSVVTESPSTASTRAPGWAATGRRSRGMSSKKGGCRM